MNTNVRRLGGTFSTHWLAGADHGAVWVKQDMEKKRDMQNDGDWERNDASREETSGAENLRVR